VEVHLASSEEIEKLPKQSTRKERENLLYSYMSNACRFNYIFTSV